MRTIALSALLLSSPLVAVPGGGLISDQTAGTRVTTDNQIHTITGGAARGANLLHSFREFNLETGETAAFQAVPETQQIISRVTGGNNSWINGKIEIKNSQADLYLVNPAGIIFGRDAELNVPGAFHVSTADYVVLADGQRVSADPEGVHLTVAAPEAFGFLDASVGEIRVEGSTLRVKSGQAIDLIGGTITLASGVNLEAAGGRIHLTAVASAGEVTQAGAYIKDKEPTRADISIHNSTLDTDNQGDSATTGRIRLQGNQIEINDGILSASNFSAYNSEGDAVILNADRQLVLNNSRIDLGVFGVGVGRGGNLVVRAAEVALTNNSKISTQAFGTGDGGSVEIDLTGTLYLSGGSEINTATEGSGSAGNILIGTRERRPAKIRLEGASRITSSSQSEKEDAGKAGQLNILAHKTIELHSGSVFNTAARNADGGSIQIKVRDWLRLRDSTITTSAACGCGGGGNIDIDPLFVLLENSKIQANAYGGKGGNIRLVADYLLLSGPSAMEASSAKSVSGEIIVQAVSVDGGSLQAVRGAEPLNVAQWLPVPCHARRGRAERLIITGYDAYPTPADDLLSAVSVRVLSAVSGGKNDTKKGLQ